MSEAGSAGEAEPTFREAISRARLQTGAVAPPLEQAPRVEARPPRFEYRVEKAGGARKERARTWSRLGAEGWELVCVDGGRAYFKREPVSGR